MATYKVLQDIEAEDTLLGPLTLRQFIYATIAILCGYFTFLAFRGAYPLIIFFPIMLVAGFLAFPWKRDQPTEIWALARVRFLILPRRRVWDQSGAKELVTVTAPKRFNQSYTDNLSQSEVRSRLRALADTIDSRGWATRNVSVAQAAGLQTADQSDRLVAGSNLPREVNADYIQPDEDIMDDNNKTSAYFKQMIDSSEANHRQHLLEQMKAASQTPMPDAGQAQAQAPSGQSATGMYLDDFAANPHAAYDATIIKPGSQPISTNDDSTPDDPELDAALKARKKTPEVASMHLRTIQPLSAKKPHSASSQPVTQNNVTKESEAPAEKTVKQQVKSDNDNAKIEESRQAAQQAQLARNNDLSVAAIARQASKKSDDNEVVVSLH